MIKSLRSVSSVCLLAKNVPDFFVLPLDYLETWISLRTFINISVLPLASPWHFSLASPFSPVSSFDWVLHGIPPGHPWCLPAMVFSTTSPQWRAHGTEDCFLAFVPCFLGDSFWNLRLVRKIPQPDNSIWRTKYPEAFFHLVLRAILWTSVLFHRWRH